LGCVEQRLSAMFKVSDGKIGGVEVGSELLRH
jgi:hypothetical protein